MLFNGEYYHIKYLPIIFTNLNILTTPVYIIFIFLFGLFYLSKRLIEVLNVKNKIILSNDFGHQKTKKSH